MGGRGGGWKEAVKKEAVSYQSKRGPRVLSQVSKERVYVGVVGARAHLFRKDQPGSTSVPPPTVTQSQEIFMTLFILTPTGASLVSTSHFHPFDHPGQ